MPAQKLIIVESPSKTKTLSKILGKDYTIKASYGHIRDLIPKAGAIDIEDTFKLNYELIQRNEKHVKAIKDAITPSVTELLLATDPDREGEAIAWHLLEHLKRSRKLKNITVKRLSFNEITPKAIKEAIANPRELNMDLINAQQARRALDYLVGFNLSPLLWKKVKTGLSAGRVQSPALKMIVERELEIEAFKQQEYWSIGATCQADSASFPAALTHYESEKLEQFSITDEAKAIKVTEAIKQDASGHLTVQSVKEKSRQRQPAPPFITSTLQQDASRKFGFSTKKTMMLAQQLYEGVDVNGSQVALITYMRTDSVNLSQDAINDIRAWLSKNHGSDYLPSTPRVFKTKSKNAQEAHEAIRPTQISMHPDQLQHQLEKDLHRLYQIIWQRAVASQMSPAKMKLVSAELFCPIATFKATGSTITFPGFLAIYEESSDDKKEKSSLLPALQEGQKVVMQAIEPKQHFTEPAPRYSEATLVKSLENHDIGRPSTYTAIISTLLKREYVILDKKRFFPTDIGRVVYRFLNEFFNQYIDYPFTAKLENELDSIAHGEHDWQNTLSEFWSPFHQQVDKIDQEVQRKDVTSEAMDEKCELCGHQLLIRLGKNGRFVGCSNYPDCKYTRPLEASPDAPQDPTPELDRKCPKCNHDLAYKVGRYGRFIGCTNYPECRHIESLNPPKELEVTCPKCNENKMVQKRSRKGKIFFACNGYPKCKYAVWDEPVAKQCPECKWPIMTQKTPAKSAPYLLCPECKHKITDHEDQ